MEVRWPKRSSAEAFFYWVVVQDYEANVFAVFGPLTSDAQWTNRVALARERGRDLTICTVCSELDAKMMARGLTAHGFSNSEAPIL